MRDAEERLYSFENIVVNTSLGCLLQDGQETYLAQKPFQVLIYLLERHDHLVSKSELMEHVWKDTAVTDDALVQCIVNIRKALHDDPRRPRFIRTVSRVGYRFVAPVHMRSTAASPS